MWSEMLKRWMEMMTWWLPSSDGDAKTDNRTQDHQSSNKPASSPSAGGHSAAAPASSGSANKQANQNQTSSAKRTSGSGGSATATKPSGSGSSTSSASADSSKGDDLTAIKGIGPSIQSRLNASGIHGFSDLAAANAETLTRQLKEQMVISQKRVQAWIDEASSQKG